MKDSPSCLRRSAPNTTVDRFTAEKKRVYFRRKQLKISAAVSRIVLLPLKLRPVGGCITRSPRRAFRWLNYRRKRPSACRYPTLLALRIGRLAVEQRFQGRGLGGALLVDAARRSIQSPPAVYALLVDAKNDHAVAFYQHHLFQPIVGLPQTLFLPLATAEKALFGNAAH